MKKLKIITIKAFIFLGLALGFTSCNLFGLDYQFDYQNGSTPANLKMDINCYEFIQSRKNIDMFILSAAIERANQKDLYEAQDMTYFLLNDTQFLSWLVSYRYSSVEDVPVSVLADLLKAYTIPGRYLSTDLTTAPVRALTVGGKKTILMQLSTFDEKAGRTYRPSVCYDVASGVYSWKGVTTSNLQPTNGVAHVLSLKL